MASERTGSVEPFKRANGATYYRARIRLGDGSRVRVDVPEKYSTPAGGKTGRERAELYAEARQEREDETGELMAEKRAGKLGRPRTTPDLAGGETCDAWFARYNAHQREGGSSDAGKKADRWNKWISPVIGGKSIAGITSDDVENVRDALDAAITRWTRDGGKSAGKKGDAISGKTAMNVWSALTSSMKEAKSSKRRDLRVRSDNPCKDVQPPGDRASRKARRKTFLYPKEAAALLACAAVPLDWREVYGVALYTYLRPGELRVLTAGDVSLDAMHVSITKAWDYQEEKIKPPKSANGVRRVPIEAALAPLLERLCKGRDATALLVPRLSAFGEDHLAEQFRKHLRAAGVTRAELHASTRTHVQSNFRSCRDSGITWLAMSGLDVAKIMRRAGHDEIGTTMGYVKLAEDLTGDLGAPLGPLPAGLIGPSIGPSSPVAPKKADKTVPEEGVET